jgi:hypothetical protein
MTTLSELIGRPITPEAKDQNRPKTEILSAPIPQKARKPHAQYEAEVFNFLLANQEALGIKAVIKFTALLIDGAVELMNGKRLTVEVKFRMNWEKACQAEWQFRTFMKRTEIKPFPVDGGIVIFEDFSGDWNRRQGGRLLENGWSHWYRGHSEIDGFRLDLLRLRAHTLDSFPIADALLKTVTSMTPEEQARLWAAAARQE